MATPRAAWGIEIGAFAVKAIRLERNGDEVVVSDFAVIPHKKVLTTPDMDQEEMVRLGLGQFISQKKLEGEHLVMSVPGHSAFARFAKLPPVEPKKVPDIVKFEAVQQIPFPIEEVEWDYQTFTSDDTPEIEVGIFAITRERVQQRLMLYSDVGLSPESMTLSPVAVFNALTYDMGNPKGPVVFIDIGTQATDVIVLEQGRCWIRTFPLGGTHFTEAIASAFKLSYSKAEKLKLEASDSKYAKQIMQAMRPVFSDLLQDLQRSIGYYQSLHRDSQLNHMIGIGSTFKIPGLRKFLSQQLMTDADQKFEIVRLDEYKKIAVTGREAASFAENAVNMATAYGLALQGVGLAPINANLVPVKTLRDSMWHAKTKWFAAAAAIVILGAGMTFYRPVTERGSLEASTPVAVNQVSAQANGMKQKLDELKQKSDIGAAATNMLSLLDYRTVWPHLLNDSAHALASTKPQPELLGDNPALILGVDPKERRLVQLNALTGEYQPGAATVTGRKIVMQMNVELSHDDPVGFLTDHVAKWLRDHAEPTGPRANVPYKIIASSIRVDGQQLETVTVAEGGGETAVATPTGPQNPAAGTPGRPNQPPRTGGNQGRGRGGGVDASGAGGGGMRTPAGPTQAAPGGGLGEGGRGSAGGGTNNPGTVAPITGQPPKPRPPVSLPGVGSEPGGKETDLEALAPVPTKPRLYQPGATIYRVPITFEVELLDPNAKPAAVANTQADATGTTAQGAAS